LISRSKGEEKSLSNSLYDISVGSYQQAIGGMITVLAKGANMPKRMIWMRMIL